MGKELGESSDRQTAAWGEFQATAQAVRNLGEPRDFLDCGDRSVSPWRLEPLRFAGERA